MVPTWSPMATASNDELYGPRASIHERFPHAANAGELWDLIDKSYPKQMEFRPFFEERGVKLIQGHELNPRNLGSAQRKYCKRVLDDSYDPESRGIPPGMEGATPQETLLMGGKQLCYGIYKAVEADRRNGNVIRALAMGYQVMMRPKNLPVDVIREIVNHSNKNNKGVKDTIGQRLMMIPEVQAAFRAHLVSKNLNKNAMPTKGEYTYYKVYATFVTAKFSDTFPTMQAFRDAKALVASVSAMPTLLERSGNAGNAKLAPQVLEFIDWIEDRRAAPGFLLNSSTVVVVVVVQWCSVWWYWSG
jgi:hypothetical protein